jgi:hypothetical protein
MKQILSIERGKWLVQWHYLLEDKSAGYKGNDYVLDEAEYRVTYVDDDRVRESYQFELSDSLTDNLELVDDTIMIKECFKAWVMNEIFLAGETSILKALSNIVDLLVRHGFWKPTEIPLRRYMAELEDELELTVNIEL